MRIRPEMSRPVCFLLTLLRLAGLSLALPSSSSAAAAATTIVGVDLVFPRNDTVYRPVWPFPIVFAVRNASQLWPSDEEHFSFWVRWDLTGYTDINDPDTGQLFTSGVWQTDKLNRTTEAVVAVIDASRRDLVGAPQRQFRLKYTATMFGSCPVNATAEGADSRPQDLSHDGHVLFTTTDPSAGAGELPAVVADETTCPAPVGRFEITGSRHESGALCPVASSSSGSPSSSSSTACGLEMDGSLADEVERTMLDRAGCPRGTWPDPDGGLSPTSCNAVSSSGGVAGAKRLGARATGVSALVLTLAASWAFV
ncbi:hypothetical protein QIS74_00426 [Colletotrichum tabaci]|uniref:DUF7136 domain-containing protein n=1 Tax=Colletotrichum tabaci TaxID=1209068 RepID=A0AAV9TTR1_9PEZI